MMCERTHRLIELGNIHGFRICGDQKKYDTLKEAKMGIKKDAAYIVVYGKSHKGVVRKVNSI
jgi:metal-dependent hydrolase (beta-lactamase superfamily II)